MRLNTPVSSSAASAVLSRIASKSVSFFATGRSLALPIVGLPFVLREGRACGSTLSDADFENAVQLSFVFPARPSNCCSSFPRRRPTRYKNGDRIAAKTNHSHSSPLFVGISGSTTTAKSSHSHHLTFSRLFIGTASALHRKSDGLVQPEAQPCLGREDEVLLAG